jgi:hypothetical protein
MICRTMVCQTIGCPIHLAPLGVPGALVCSAKCNEKLRLELLFEAQEQEQAQEDPSPVFEPDGATGEDQPY